jgi:hypothetical protein
MQVKRSGVLLGEAGDLFERACCVGLFGRLVMTAMYQTHQEKVDYLTMRIEVRIYSIAVRIEKLCTNSCPSRAPRRRMMPSLVNFGFPKLALYVFDSFVCIWLRRKVSKVCSATTSSGRATFTSLLSGHSRNASSSSHRQLRYVHTLLVW